MYAKLSCKCDGATEEEESVDNVEPNHDDGVKGKLFLDSSRYQVEKRQHSKDADEDDIVDDRRVATHGFRDHVADEGHDEERPEELQARVNTHSWRGSKVSASAYLQTTKAEIDHL